MALFDTLETQSSVKSRLRDAGVPSASIALRDTPSSSTVSHVFTCGDEDTETIYQACSISKAITALGIARLVDQGLLAYDTRLVDHLPRETWNVIVDSKTEHLMNHVTVGLLLSHRSGLSQHGFPGYSGETIPSAADVLAGKAPANTPRMKFLSFPGSQCAYSGGGFVLLQLLVERISGKKFSELMHALVFEPLGMNRSRYGSLPAEEQNFAKAHKTAEVLGTDNGRGYFEFLELAAAGLWTTPSDLLKAVAAIQLSLDGDGGFLSQATAKKMLTATYPAYENIGTFGMGWSVDETFFAHAGDNEPGYVTYLIGTHSLSGPKKTVIPGYQNVGQMSLAIMTNSALGFESLRKIVAAIFRAKRWSAYPSLPSSFGSMTDFVPYSIRGDITFSRDWQSFQGHWVAPESSGHAVKYDIIEQAGLPHVKFPGIDIPMRLIPAAMSWHMVNESRQQSVFVVEGLEMAFRMRVDQAGVQAIEVMQKRKAILKRV